MKDFVDTQREEGNVNGVFLSDFLQEVSLLSDLDGGDDDDEKGRVALMTVHSAKGLEFPTVFIVGMEENIFPSMMASNTMKELEEERRLFYVAITRAEKHCIITSAQHRLRYGRSEFNPRSRFINDIDRRYMDVVGGVGVENARSWTPRQEPRTWKSIFTLKNDEKPSATTSTTRKTEKTRKPEVTETPGNTPPAFAGLRQGAIIEHQRFGIGRVVRIEGTGENQKATVEFKNTGTKQLLLKFARYKIIS